MTTRSTLVLCQGRGDDSTTARTSAMTTIDSGKRDHKIPPSRGDPESAASAEATAPPHRLMMLRRFFQDYKQLEGKSVAVDDFQSSELALPIIEDALQRYSQHRRKGFEGRH